MYFKPARGLTGAKPKPELVSICENCKTYSSFGKLIGHTSKKVKP
jgi:hypothetical protein